VHTQISLWWRGNGCKNRGSQERAAVVGREAREAVRPPGLTSYSRCSFRKRYSSSSRLRPRLSGKFLCKSSRSSEAASRQFSWDRCCSSWGWEAWGHVPRSLSRLHSFPSIRYSACPRFWAQVRCTAPPSTSSRESSRAQVPICCGTRPYQRALGQAHGQDGPHESALRAHRRREGRRRVCGRSQVDARDPGSHLLGSAAGRGYQENPIICPRPPPPVFCTTVRQLRTQLQNPEALPLTPGVAWFLYVNEENPGKYIFYIRCQK
jgi:hypothetical protein